MDNKRVQDTFSKQTRVIQKGYSIQDAYLSRKATSYSQRDSQTLGQKGHPESVAKRFEKEGILFKSFPGAEVGRRLSSHLQLGNIGAGIGPPYKYTRAEIILSRQYPWICRTRTFMYRSIQSHRSTYA